MTDLSFVILSYNSQRCIGQCLRHLMEALRTLGLSHDIWIVDNGSSDESLSIIREHQAANSAVQVIALPTNLGTTVPRNLALRKCQGEHIVIMDSDAYVSAASLEYLLQKSRLRQEVGILVPKLIFPDGRFQLSVDQFPTITRKIHRFMFLRSLERNSEQPREETVDYAISAFWLLPRAVLEKVGLLDENIFYSPEDVDYCLRVWQAGLQVRYDPAVSIVHDAQEKSRGWKLNRFTWLHLQGLFYYFCKHRYAFRLNKLRKRLHIPHS